MKISSAIVAHHGIVAGMYDDLGIGKIIDEIIPKQGQHKLAHSVVLKAMILNALGFNDVNGGVELYTNGGLKVYT